MFTLLNPLEQFDVIILLNLYKNFAFTNFTFMMIINFLVVILLFKSFQSVFNLNSIEFCVRFLFIFVKDILKDNMSIKKYSFIFLFYFIFLFILVSNLLGMIPYSITITRCETLCCLLFIKNKFI
jgi:F0F1-type ATP synthase membrane subunit a